MASADSQRDFSSSTCSLTYNVYLNFYAQDIGNSFADHLCSAMKKNGINVVADDERLEREEDSSLGLSSPIQEFKWAVVVISKNYAFSERCLMKLIEIVERRRETRLKVLPVFYNVIPSDVGKQKNNFEEAFAKHRADPEIDEEQTEKWRAALREVSVIAGWDVCNRRESEVIGEICKEIVGANSSNISGEMPTGEMLGGNSSNIFDELPSMGSGLERLRRRIDDARELLRFSLTSFFFL